MTGELFATTDHAPLAHRMRPTTLEDYVGQDHILAKGKMLRRSIEADMISSVILYGTPGCHSRGTKILMFDGSTKAVEDIQIGDILMGPDSQPRKVLALVRGVEPMVKITPKQGDEFVVNLGHILSLKFSGKNKSFHPETAINISVREFLKSTKVTQERLKLWRTGVEFSTKKVPLPPYIFGYWLGNNNRTGVTIRDSHIEVLNHWETWTKSQGCHRKSYRRGTSKCETHRYHTPKGKANPFLKRLRETGASETKHIPDNYKCNDRSTRLQVLAGILDADGYAIKGGGYGLTLKSEKLARDTAFLSRSLGIATSLLPKKGTWTYAGKKKSGHYWRLNFSLTNTLAKEIGKFLLAKRIQKPNPNKNPQKTGFTTSILKDGTYYGFSIDQDHLYLTEDFTVHHNCGKTTLARIIANHTKSHFEELNATESSVSDIRKAAEAAKSRLAIGEKTILFIDEIHRFNKGQQDALLPHVETGTIRLVGATTQNPFFAINGPLVSRSLIVQLKELSDEEVIRILRRAVERELTNAVVEEDAYRLLAARSDGDARRALNGLELAYRTGEPCQGKVMISQADVAESIQKKTILYDQDGDAHYDTISAFIKSLRGSNPDGALYWLAKMIEAGEEPRYIARRLVVHASEDVGMADPTALLVATAAQSAVETIGMPEAQIPLAQATIHIALAPKSNSACRGISEARAYVQQNPLLPIPKHLRDTHYEGAALLGNGEGYKYPHNFPHGVVEQEYLPKPVKLYHPSTRGVEREMNEALELRMFAAKQAKPEDKEI